MRSAVSSMLCQERIAVQLQTGTLAAGMLQACAFASVPGMYFFRSGTSMPLPFWIQQEKGGIQILNCRKKGFPMMLIYNSFIDGN